MAAIAHNKTHHGRRHRIKTRHGLSKKSYQSSNEEPMEGTGQGSGGSPAIRLIFMVSLLMAYKKFTAGMKVMSPFTTLCVLNVAVYYVDDGMPGVNNSDSVQPQSLQQLEAAESSAQSWERLLFVSGGRLELLSVSRTSCAGISTQDNTRVCFSRPKSQVVFLWIRPTRMLARGKAPLDSLMETQTAQGIYRQLSRCIKVDAHWESGSLPMATGTMNANTGFLKP
jgi:hypothetical protein